MNPNLAFAIGLVCYAMTVIGCFQHDMGMTILFGCLSLFFTWLASSGRRGDYHRHDHTHDHLHLHGSDRSGGLFGTGSGGPGGDPLIHDQRRRHRVITGDIFEYDHRAAEHVHLNAPQTGAIALQVPEMPPLVVTHGQRRVVIADNGAIERGQLTSLAEPKPAPALPRSVDSADAARSAITSAPPIALPPPPPRRERKSR